MCSVSPDGVLAQRHQSGLMDISTTRRAEQTPTDMLLTASLVIAPLVYLLADSLYAARGWDDANAGAFHVLGAIGYSFVLVRLASWARGWLAATTLFVGLIGAAGNVAYGFNTIHVSLGAVDLVDTSGPGAIIKPLGLFFPLSLVLSAIVLSKLDLRFAAVAVALAGLAWPVAHIGNIAWLAVVVNVVLVAALVPLAWTKEPSGPERRQA
ncbi:hypothetical protein BH09ACT10_BH09ACT10_29840 [soil metagenome]